MRRLICALLAGVFCVYCAAIARAEWLSPEGGGAQNSMNARSSGVIFSSSDEVYEAFPLAGIKIGIDPGHQARANNEKETIAPDSSETKAKVSSGTRGTASGVYEYIVNLDVSLALADALKELGAEVLMTRQTHDVDISNQQRAIMMNDWGADAVLRIHCNGSTDSSVHGMGMYVRKTGACAEESYALAEYLGEAMRSFTNAKLSGPYRRDTYTGLNWSQVPCVLVEMGYMSNRDEDLLLSDPEYQEKLVLGMAYGIIEYIDSVRRASE